MRDLLFASCFPRTRGALDRLVSDVERKLLSRVRSLVEGYGRFTRHVLGLEPLDVIAAWMAPLAARLRGLPLDGVTIDESVAQSQDDFARSYWQDHVG